MRAANCATFNKKNWTMYYCIENQVAVPILWGGDAKRWPSHDMPEDSAVSPRLKVEGEDTLTSEHLDNASGPGVDPETPQSSGNERVRPSSGPHIASEKALSFLYIFRVAFPMVVPYCCMKCLFLPFLMSCF